MLVGKLERILEYTFALCVLSNDMSYYLYQIKRKLILLEYGDKPKLLRGLDIGIPALAEYNVVFIFFKFVFVELKETITQHNFFYH